MVQGICDSSEGKVYPFRPRHSPCREELSEFRRASFIFLMRPYTPFPGMWSEPISVKNTSVSFFSCISGS